MTNGKPIPPLPDWAIPVVRMWERETGRGRFLSGKWGGARVLLFPNPQRRDDRDAEWMLCLAAGDPEPSRRDTKEF